MPSTHTHVLSHQILGIMPLPFLLELHLLLYPPCPPGSLEWLLKISLTSVSIPSSMFVLRASDLQMLTGEDHSVEETLDNAGLVSSSASRGQRHLSPAYLPSYAEHRVIFH